MPADRRNKLVVQGVPDVSMFRGDRAVVSVRYPERRQSADRKRLRSHAQPGDARAGAGCDPCSLGADQMRTAQRPSRSQPSKWTAVPARWQEALDADPVITGRFA